MIRHLILDCFGTLMDTGNGSILAVKQILANVGSTADAKGFYADWKCLKKQKMQAPVFQNEKTLFEISLAETFQKYGIQADAAEAVKPMIRSLFAERIVFPEVKETLRLLEEKGIDYAIGSTTDTDSLAYYLNQNALLFDRIYTSEDMQVYKPEPKFYETILNRSGWRLEECLFVGDNYIDDVCGPKKIGMQAALLDRKGAHTEHLLEPAPDYIIRSLHELTELL